MRKLTPLSLLTLILLLGGSLLHATLVPRMSVEQMIDDSELIVHGTVLRTWSAWDSPRQFIWTHYELEVSDTMKGIPGGTLVISEPGGIVGDTGMEVVGAPRYDVGEEVVLFVTRTPTGYLRSCGWGQGTFDIEEDAGTRVKVVHSATGVPLVDVPSRQASALQARQTAVDSLDGLALGDFKTRLRSLISARAAEGGR